VRDSTTPPWYVLGAGAIGCLFAAHLRRAGVPVRLLLRDDEALRALQCAGGIALDDEAPVAIDADSITALPHGTRIQKLLVCTKAHQTLAAIAAVHAYLVDDAAIVLLQNGMGVREQLAALLPGAKIFNALTTEGAWRRERFSVVHAGRGETLLGGADSDPARALAGELARSGLAVRAVDDIESRLWQKLAVNCVINPLTALWRCRNGDLLARPETADWTRRLCDEIARVAAAQGVVLHSDALQQRVQAVMNSTAANQSSMLQDVLQGRATEIDYLNGYVVALAQRHAIDVPANRALLDAIRNREGNQTPNNTEPGGFSLSEM
jgi:2-dehydropantoate 2-reductase